MRSSLNDMKEKLISLAARYAILNLAFLPVLIFLRFIEYYYLLHVQDILDRPFTIETAGLWYDLNSFLVFALIMFLPFIVLSLLNRKTGIIFYIILLCLITILQIALVRYFSVNLFPLNEVLFRYSFGEIIMVINSSESLDFWSFLPFFLSLILLSALQFLSRKLTFRNREITLLVLLFLVALTLSFRSSNCAKDYESDVQYHYRVNKSAYFIGNGIDYLLWKKSSYEPSKISKAIEKYQKMHSEFNFFSERYPLLHKDNTQDVLGPFFELRDSLPNIVFIIFESLSTAYIGEQSWYGNFTPFLDSLKDRSLFWPNFLSISERTFHVLQALFASLPYGSGELQRDMGQMPYHSSLIQYLHDNGYFVSFFYGGDANFTNYKQFLKKHQTDYILEDFGPKYDQIKAQYPDFEWGHHDEYVFARSIEVIDSLQKQPRLDIYLTLSTHSPYDFPEADFYMNQYDRITSQPEYPPEKKKKTDLNKKLFAAILYSDDALRSFFETYSWRADFKNTIFFITGDHFSMELGYSSISSIERYHVPLIIYSPLLKETKQFNSVSSHQDVTPTLIAMINNHYEFDDHPYVHWVGNGIDTTSRFRNTHAVQFVSSSQAKNEFLKNKFFLSNNRLFEIQDGLKTIPINDNKKQNQLKDELKTTDAVFNYAMKENRIILPELIMTIDYDTTLIISFDSVGLQFGKNPNKYIPVIDPFELSGDYRGFGIDIKFQYTIAKAIYKDELPWLVMTIEDTTLTNSMYDRLQFPGIPPDQIIPGEWHTFQLEETLDANFLKGTKGSYLKLYFFNHHFCPIRYDSIRLRLTGIN